MAKSDLPVGALNRKKPIKPDLHPRSGLIAGEASLKFLLERGCLFLLGSGFLIAHLLEIILHVTI